MNDTKTQDHSVRLPSGGTYGFSAVRVEDLGACEYTLVTIVVDESGSVLPFADRIEACIAEVVRACHRSPRVDRLLLRVVMFDDKLRELHGFTPLPDCDADSYRGTVKSGGGTALIDALLTATEATSAYAGTLAGAGFDVNGIVFAITDGADNGSQHEAAALGNTIATATAGGGLESLAVVLVGVGTEDTALLASLRGLHRAAKLTALVPIERADADKLAALARLVARSIAVQSQALGSGGASIGF